MKTNKQLSQAAMKQFILFVFAMMTIIGGGSLIIANYEIIGLLLTLPGLIIGGWFMGKYLFVDIKSCRELLEEE